MLHGFDYQHYLLAHTIIMHADPIRHCHSIRLKGYD
jgi:hypothetical protein